MPRFFIGRHDVKNLQEATERICQLKGSLIALDALLPALIDALPLSAHADVMASFDAHAEAARTILLPTDISDVVLAAFEHDVARNRQMLSRCSPTVAGPSQRPTVDALLLTTTRISTFLGARVLTSASGFFFRRGARLFLVTNRHVFADEASAHFPDRIEIGVHTDQHDLTSHAVISLPLYEDALSRWRDAKDTGGAVDVATIEIPPGGLPPDAVLEAFDETHLDAGREDIAIGDALSSRPGRHRDRGRADHRRLPARLPRHRAPSGGGSKRVDRLVLRRPVPAAGVLPHRRANSPRKQRCASLATSSTGRRRLAGLTVAAPGHSFDTNGHAHPRPRRGRVARAQLRLVCGCPGAVDRMRNMPPSRERTKRLASPWRRSAQPEGAS